MLMYTQKESRGGVLVNTDYGRNPIPVLIYKLGIAVAGTLRGDGVRQSQKTSPELGRLLSI